MDPAYHVAEQALSFDIEGGRARLVENVGAENAKSAVPACAHEPCVTATVVEDPGIIALRD